MTFEGTDYRVEQGDKLLNTHVYYFGGVMMTTSHLEPIRKTMVAMYKGKENVTVLTSSLSKDLPMPRKLDIASDIVTRLGKGENITLICHSLGTVEAMRVVRAIKPEIIKKYREQISIDLISPAGLFTNAKGMVEFLRRFINNSVLREKLRATLRRGLETLTIYPPEGMEGMGDMLRGLYPDWEPAIVYGVPDDMKKLLNLDQEKLDVLRDIDNKMWVSIVNKDSKQLEAEIKKRGKLISPFITKFQIKQKTEVNGGIEKREKLKLRFRNFFEAGKILTRLLTGKTNQTLKELWNQGQGVKIRFMYLAGDPLVLKQDIMDFFETNDWNDLVKKKKWIILVGYFGHATHVVVPKVLEEFL